MAGWHAYVPSLKPRHFPKQKDAMSIWSILKKEKDTHWERCWSVSDGGSLSVHSFTIRFISLAFWRLMSGWEQLEDFSAGIKDILYLCMMHREYHSLPCELICALLNLVLRPVEVIRKSD